MKILIAEDDENSRYLLETILTADGYAVISFENGLNALQYLQTDFVDLIIADILMPEMDGYGLCRAVKQNYLLQDTPFIFYTATYTSAQDEQFALSLGATKFLVKPMLIPELLAVVAEVFKTESIRKPPKNLGLSLNSSLNIDEQHVERVRAKLEKKIHELSDEQQKLLASEARFRDFAEASADWFWESDQNLKINALAGSPTGLNFRSLTELAKACHSHNTNDMLKTLEAHQNFADFVVRFTDVAGKLAYLRVSGKAVFDKDARFTGYRGVGRDVSDMVALNRRLEFIATHDELTGLPNRSMLRQHLEHTLAMAARSGQQVLLLFFDLDNFKMVNDSLGHEAGDELLIKAAKRITERVRATDVLARLGGDEFVMVMEGASPQDGHRFVRDIIEAFAQPFDIQQQSVYCTVSIGVSVYPDDTKDPQTLMGYADLAMYRAKQNGRHDFEFYTSKLNFIAHQWLEMEHGIREALKDQQFFVVYQPQVENQQQQLVGMEVLIRWRHPERGLISPMDFIKIAEQSSLINQIGEWVLDATCQQMRAWLDQGYKVPRVSINISARHIRSEGFCEALLTIPAKYQINPNRLCIEITEYALLEEMNIVKKNMLFLKEAGFSVSLDDFGMGHSSLLYLKRWSIDEVKIDRSFIEGLVGSEGDRIIVKAMVSLSNALSLKLVGEGVENQQQADILAASGCIVVQGYFYSPPIEASQMESWLKK
ncbi:MAG: EAL domain-containing protein [Methylococcaceae bacterium]|nr:EAL domain-containing protein [Methylococcaceae bacterium]